MIPVLIKIKKWYSIIDFIIKMLYNIIGGDKMKLFKRENYLSKIIVLFRKKANFIKVRGRFPRSSISKTLYPPFPHCSFIILSSVSVLSSSIIYLKNILP